jgi:hypothetical protein
MTDVYELLRRDGAHWRDTATIPPRVDWAGLPSGRRTARPSWWMVTVTAAAAAGVAALAILVPSLLDRGTGTPAPAHRPNPAPSAHTLGGPASFIALTSGGVEQADARTGESRGMAVSESGRRETALAVTDDGNVGYATYSHPRCQVVLHRYRWTSPTTSEGTDAATIAGAKADAVAVSPDGHLVALAVEPCTQSSRNLVDDLVVVDLESQQQRRWTGYADGSSLSGLQWGPDNQTLAYVAAPCCGGGSEGPRLLDTTAAGRSYVRPRPLSIDQTVGRGLVFWLRGRLAVVMGSDVRALTTAGTIGPVLATGLPANVVAVRSDRTGAHLLLTTQDGALLRWDDGIVTRLPGRWRDAGW